MHVSNVHVCVTITHQCQATQAKHHQRKLNILQFYLVLMFTNWILTPTNTKRKLPLACKNIFCHLSTVILEEMSKTTNFIIYFCLFIFWEINDSQWALSYIEQLTYSDSIIVLSSKLSIQGQDANFRQEIRRSKKNFIHQIELKHDRMLYIWDYWVNINSSFYFLWIIKTASTNWISGEVMFSDYLIKWLIKCL